MVPRVPLRGKLKARVLEARHHLESLVVHRWTKRRPTALESQVLHDLRTEGVHVTTIEALLPETARSLRETFRLAMELLHELPFKRSSGRWRRGSASSDLRAEVMLDLLPQLYLFGLDAGLLALAEQYLRLPVAYHGAVLRHSLVDGVDAGPRLWHQDEEDFRLVRMVVYLNDVSVGGGPFEYIPRSVKLTYKQFARLDDEVTDELTNERVRAVVPVERWKRIYGAAGTVVLADTAQVFHHESLQTERDRTVVMMGYSSRHPRSIGTAMAHFPVEDVEQALKRMVPTANYPHVFSWRRGSYALKARAADVDGNAA